AVGFATPGAGRSQMTPRGSITISVARATPTIGATNGPSPKAHAAAEPAYHPTRNQSGPATMRFMAECSGLSCRQAIAHSSRYEHADGVCGHCGKLPCKVAPAPSLVLSSTTTTSGVKKRYARQQGSVASATLGAP